MASAPRGGRSSPARIESRDRMPKLWPLVVVASLSFLTSVHAKEPDTIAGAGNILCEELRRQDETTELILFTWMQGYLSGYSLALHDALPSSPRIDLNPESKGSDWQRRFIRDYCEKHPKSPYFEVAAVLHLELAKDLVTRSKK